MTEYIVLKTWEEEGRAEASSAEGAIRKIIGHERLKDEATNARGKGYVAVPLSGFHELKPGFEMRPRLALKKAGAQIEGQTSIEGEPPQGALADREPEPLVGAAT